MAVKPTTSGHKAGADAEEPCHLLMLPPELRNQIYHLAFGQIVFAEPLDVTIRAHDMINSEALLRTCRQIHEETHRIYYAACRRFCTDNTFELDARAREGSNKHIDSQLAAIAPRALTWMRHFRVRTHVSVLMESDAASSGILRLFYDITHDAAVTLVRRDRGDWSCTFKNSPDDPTDKEHFVGVQTWPCAVYCINEGYVEGTCVPINVLELGVLVGRLHGRYGMLL